MAAKNGNGNAVLLIFAPISAAALQSLDPSKIPKFSIEQKRYK